MPEPRRRRAFNVERDLTRRRDETFGSGWDEVTSSIEPLSNVTVGVEEITITLDVPFVDQKQVRVQIHGKDVLEVYAKTKRTVRFDDLGIKHRSGEFTCYRALVNLPGPVDGARATHRLKRGILEIRLPKLR